MFSLKTFKYILLIACLIFQSYAFADRLITIGSTSTELVFALGLGEKVVAVDQSSLNPPEARKLPQVGYIRMISPEGILALDPTHIITGNEIGPKATLDKLKKTGIPITIVQTPNSIDELIDQIKFLSKDLKVAEKGEKITLNILNDYQKIQFPEKAAKVIFLMHHPFTQTGLNAAGKHTKADKIIKLAGGENLIKEHSGYRSISKETLFEINPEIILVGVPENLTTNKEEIMKILFEDRIFDKVPAIKNNNVLLLPLSKTLSFSHTITETISKLTEAFSSVP